MATTTNRTEREDTPAPEVSSAPPDDHRDSFLLKRLYLAFDDRTGLITVLRKVMAHPVPPAPGWKGWMYVLGSATLFTFIVQVVTGIALATVYVPATNAAYDSLQFISHSAAFGNQLRGIHNFGASAMVILVGCHAMRVFLTGSYKFPREVNWLTGVVLLFMTLGMAFTGQLLRWDQDGVWTVVILVQQAGRTPLIGTVLAHLILAGNTVGGATLSRFFAFHVFFIPALIFAFVGVHLYLVLHDGISEVPSRGRPVHPRTYRAWYAALLKREGVPFWPDAAWRDVVMGVSVITGIVAFALFMGAPELGKPPDPTVIEAEPRPDWYFLWYFGVLALSPAKMEDYIIIGGPLVLSILLIAIPFISNHGERSPLRRPWAVATVVLTLLMITVNTVIGSEAPWSPKFKAQPLPAGVIKSDNAQVTHGALLFHDKGCEYCHMVGGYGGTRGPDLSRVAERLTPEQMTVRILNGGTNMPAFGSNLNPQEMDDLVAFLRTRTSR